MFADAAHIGVYLLILFAPGAAAAIAAGLRGWLLVGTAPLLGYAMGAIAGPALGWFGVPFNLVTFAVTAVVLTAALGVARWSASGRGGSADDAGPPWLRSEHLAVAGCVALAAVGSGAVFLWGLGDLNAVAQTFDAPFHANGIRYIAETGDGGAFGMGAVHWYDGGSFYPNGYHLLAAVDLELTGATVPAVLNAHTVVLFGLIALCTAVFVRHFRGSPALAGYSALTVVAATSVSWGTMSSPLLPFVLSVALLPVLIVLAHRYLQRPAPDTGLLLAVGAVAELTIHSSALFNGVLLAVPMLAYRWWTAPARLRQARRDGLALLAVAVPTLILAAPELLGALALVGSDYPYLGWPANTTFGHALGDLVAFQHNQAQPQVWLAVALAIGLATYRKLGDLRWIGCAGVLFGGLAVLVSSSDSAMVTTLARPWWDDPFRLVALTTLVLCVIAAHGLAQAQSWLGGLLRARASWIPGRTAGAVAAVAVLVGFLVLSNGLYARRHAVYVAANWGNTEMVAQPTDEMVVSKAEVTAMRELAERADPDDRVLNEWFDGSAWTYAITGVRSVVSHYEVADAPADTKLLTEHFRDYATRPDVRAAADRLDVRWVLVTEGRMFGDSTQRPPGLRQLADLPFLERVYANDMATLYRVLR